MPPWLRHSACILAVLVLAATVAASALAQVPPGLPNPDLQNRIPAPLPPPPQPPVINGPLSQRPPPAVYQTAIAPKEMLDAIREAIATKPVAQGAGQTVGWVELFARPNADKPCS